MNSAISESTDSLRDILINKGWATNFNADTLVQLIERHYTQSVQKPEPRMPTDENIMKLMSPQMHKDLSFAACAMAGTDNIRVKETMRIMLNRHVVDLARAALVYWGQP